MTDLQRIPLEELAASFDSKGYELLMEERVPNSLNVEESIIAALLQMVSRLIEGIPTILTKNKINYPYLQTLIDKHKLWNEFGYLGEFTLKHHDNRNLKYLVKHCRNKQKPQAYLTDFFYISSREFQKEEEKRWNLFGAPSYTSLDQQYKRYND